MKVLSTLLTPIAWAIGFLWPLFAQLSLAADWTASVGTAYALALPIALSWGVMAQLRGSWLWVR